MNRASARSTPSIGILSAIAVPKYQKAHEQSVVSEALLALKTIYQAQESFLLANGRYAEATEMNKLEVSIPGTKVYQSKTGLTGMRIQTKNFIIGASSGAGSIGIAHRYINDNLLDHPYHIYIRISDKTYHCSSGSSANRIQKGVCSDINKKNMKL